MENVKNLSGQGYIVPLCGTDQNYVVPSDTLIFEPSNLYIGGAGDLEIALASDPDKICIWKDRPVGDFPYLVIRVLAANTTATNLIRVR